MGIMMASAPIFLMKAESTVTVTSKSSICPCRELKAGKKRLMARSTTPERATPALTTRALPTMITRSSEKPEKASLAGTSPRATAATRATQATTS